MKILISNDDGIHAPGINALIDTLCAEHELYIAAPAFQKSASSHALTMHHPIKVREIEDERTVKSWSIEGNPADCTKMALEELLGFRPDWVIAGVNHGPNLGTDILYSGTVAAAAEGVLLGIPSMALSLVSYTNVNFTEACKGAKIAMDWLFQNPVSRDVLLNVNIPDLPISETKGLCITTVGESKYEKPFNRRIDPRGNVYYWLAGDLVMENNLPESDVSKSRDGYITVTPIRFAFDACDAYDVLRAKLKKEE